MEDYQFIIRISFYAFCFVIGAVLESFNLRHDQIIYSVFERMVVKMKKLFSKLDKFTILAMSFIVLVFYGGYIEKNYNFVYLGFTAILILITYKNTQSSVEMVSETSKMRKAQTQPNVYVAIQPVDELNEIMEFFIQNIGLGPAYHIKVVDPPVFQYAKEKLLSEVHLIKNEIEFLAPNQKMQVFMMQSFEVFELNPKDPINIRIKYVDSEDKEFERDYKIDFSIVKDVQRIKKVYTKFESNLLNNAKEINKSLSNLSNISSNLETIAINSIDSTGIMQSDSSKLLFTTEDYTTQVEISPGSGRTPE
jgi:hypothetical protein